MDKLRYAQQNPVACPAPFTKISLDNNLNYSCCCNLDLSEFKGFEQLQLSIRNNVQSPACHVCYSEELRGVPSERMNLILNSSDDKFLELCDNFNFKERELFVKFSNLCTLACRSCSSSDSSTYAKITNNRDQSQQTDLSADITQWASLLDLLESTYQSDLPILHVIGGETLVQPGFYKTIKWLVDNGYSKKFELRVTTSLAVNLTDEILEAIKPFRVVCLNLSIDSVGENYHYIRWPAQFEKVEKNLKILAEFEHPRKIVIIQPLLSINNVFYFNNFVNYFSSWISSLSFDVPVRPIYLHNPASLDVTNLPMPYRSHAIKYLEHALTQPFLHTQPALKLYIESIIKNLKLDKINDATAFTTYLKYTAEFDCRTQTDFSFYNKVLWDLLTPEDKQIYLNHRAQVNINISLQKSIINVQSKI